MKIEFDLRKRDRTLAERGLDFTDAEEIFNGREATYEDIRHSYGEPRFVTFGYLRGRMIAVAWTERVLREGPIRRIISMRKANGREIEAYWKQFGED